MITRWYYQFSNFDVFYKYILLLQIDRIYLFGILMKIWSNIISMAEYYFTTVVQSKENPY